MNALILIFFFFQAEDGIRDADVTGVQTCALPISEIEHHVTNTFGWSATAGAVDEWIYDEIAGRYILDSAMLQRLRSANPYATRSLAARLIEAHGRGFWSPNAEVMDQLHGALGGLEDQIEHA